MKFAQVPIGQRFGLQGRRYLKTSPAVAAEEAGGRSRFVGKYLAMGTSFRAQGPARGDADQDRTLACALARA